MAEAILTRSGTSSEIADIPVGKDEAKVFVTVKDSSGLVLGNVPINCNDAGTFINYSTNSNGQCLFTVKSGWANLNVLSQYSNNLIMADQKSLGWYNIEAAVGKVIRHEIKFEEMTNGSLKNGNYTFIIKNSINISVAGGVGGGGGSYSYNDSYGYYTASGGDGGGAKIINQTIPVVRNNIYKVTVGDRGKQGNSGYGWWHAGMHVSSYPQSGTSGGTSVFNNISASGGGGGAAGYTDGNYSKAPNGTSYGSHRDIGHVKWS